MLEALYRRILLAHKEQKPFRVIIVMPLLPGFQVNFTGLLCAMFTPLCYKLTSMVNFHYQGGLDDVGAATVRAITHWQYRTISREKHSILANLRAVLGPKTEDYISFYGLRSHGRLFADGPMVTSQVLHYVLPFYAASCLSNLPFPPEFAFLGLVMINNVLPVKS